MLSKENILEVLKKLDKNKYGIIKIGLFGSYAREEATEDSDIDLFVEPDYNTNVYDNLYELREYLQKLFNKKIDILTAGHLEYEYTSPRAKEYRQRVKEKILSSVQYA